VVEVSEQTGPVGSPEEGVAWRELDRRLREFSAADLRAGLALLETMKAAIGHEALRRRDGGS